MLPSGQNQRREKIDLSMGRRRRLPNYLNASELDTLIAFAKSSIDAARTSAKRLTAHRDYVMIETGHLTGVRVSEMCKLRVEEHIDLVGQVLAVKRGKGDRDRYIPIAEKLLPVLKTWLNGRTDGWLFPGPGGRKLSERSFRRRIADLAKRAGIAKRTHPHILRHTFATGYLRVDGDLKELQQLMGHSSLQTTAGYLHVEVSRLKRSIDRL